MSDSQRDFAALVYDDHQDPDTVLRDWRLAKAWLAREMGKAAAVENETGNDD